MSLKRRFAETAMRRAGRKFVVPHFAGGVVGAPELRKLAETFGRFAGLKIKLTGEMVIGGLTDDKMDEVRRALEMETTEITGFSVRAVRVCAGGYICDNNHQESFELALRLDSLFHQEKVPFKLVIAVSGCGRCCAESKVKEIGIVASAKGYDVYAGGAGGRTPRISRKVAESLDEEEVVKLVERIIEVYRENGKDMERLGAFIERVGVEEFRSACGL